VTQISRHSFVLCCCQYRYLFVSTTLWYN